MWMLRAQNGEPEKRTYSAEQADETRAWIRRRANENGWI